jgi:hypothetical protein
MATNRTRKNATRTTINAFDIGDDLRITKIERRTSSGGAWVRGTIAGHRFDCLVFSEHAECPDYELADSRISKIWVQRLSDKATVVNFDRGWDVRPTTKAAQAIVDFLAAGLAEHIYNK